MPNLIFPTDFQVTIPLDGTTSLCVLDMYDSGTGATQAVGLSADALRRAYTRIGDALNSLDAQAADADAASAASLAALAKVQAAVKVETVIVPGPVASAAVGQAPVAQAKA